jgi:hypothetical protein
MNNKLRVAIEVVWIITGLLCIVAGVRYAISTGGSRTYLFALMALISFAFAWFRHNQRKKN